MALQMLDVELYCKLLELSGAHTPHVHIIIAKLHWDKQGVKSGGLAIRPIIDNSVKFSLRLGIAS